jgi:cytochrome c peroxidase
MIKRNIFLFLVALSFLACSSTSTNDNSNDNNVITNESSSEDENTTSSSNGDATISTYTYEEMLDGKELFLEHCALCHNTDAKGLSGPNILGYSLDEISNAILTISDMIYLQDDVNSSNEELISYYIDYLTQYYDNSDSELNSLKTSLGKNLFFDTNLSLTRSISCSSCHNANHAYIDAREGNPIDGALSVGDDGVTLGSRNAPTASYSSYNPNFYEMSDGTYIGGQFWDGRADDLQEQAKGPFLDSSEMMMPNKASVVSRVLENSDYIDQFKEIYGDDIFNDTNTTYEAIAEVIAEYEKTDTFSPFDSKYDKSKLATYNVDYYQMSEEEEEGYELFFSDKLHCNQCHSVSSGDESTVELFTNYRYENIGVPKNEIALIARDGDISTTDYGLGEDINNTEFYGKFKVPTLRNIAVTGPYMSNGVFKNLETVIKYFNYMAGAGNIINPETNETWSDPEVNSTVNTEVLSSMEPLSDSEISALISFLKLLTDEKFEELMD